MMLKKIDDLYAERRGLTPSRVALRRKEHGGRRYGQIVLKKEQGDEERLLEVGVEMQPLQS